MNTKHKPDNIFRTRFADFSKEPPPDAWEKIRAGMPPAPKAAPFTMNRLWLYLTGGTILLVATLSIILFTMNGNKNSDGLALSNGMKITQGKRLSQHEKERKTHTLFSFAPGDIENKNAISDKSDYTGARPGEDPVTAARPPLPPADETPQAQLPKTEDQNTQIPESAINSGAEATNDPAADTVTTSGKQLPLTETQPANNPDPSTDVTDINGSGQPSDQQNNGVQTAVTENSMPEAKTEIKENTTPAITNKPVDYGKTSGWEIAINAVPEYMLTNIAGARKWNYSYEICGTYNLKNFTLQGGIGLGSSEKQLSRELLFNVNHISGSYQDVTAYTWDSINHRPVFTTETVNYYDSVQQTQTMNSSSKYTLIHFPLLIGYKYDVKNFTFLVRGGLQYAVVIAEKRNSITSSMNGARLIEDKQTGPQANKDGLAVMLNLGVAYNINQRFGIAVEPTFRYHIKNIYGLQGDAEKPYSIGIRAGVILKL